MASSIYDFPKYYDLLFGSDWKAEFDFLRACFDKYARRPVRRIFEPACGTGRLLIKLAQAGYEVSGNDLNCRAVDYCNARLARHGFRPAAMVGDMSDFRLPRKVDAAFNMINTFRHLHTAEQAAGHLRSVAGALAKGGLYILGFHLTPSGSAEAEESWAARRGNLGVTFRMWSTRLNRPQRRQWFRMAMDVYTPLRRSRVEEEVVFRTYTADQFAKLLKTVNAFEVVATHDFAYDIEEPTPLSPETEDVVYVLRRK